MKKSLLVGAVVLALIISAGVAVASIPSADGTIHACRNLKSGALRAIDVDAGQTCDSKTEAALIWNQTGPQGPAGPSVMPVIETHVFHYEPRCDSCDDRFAIETIACPSGMHAINGGVLQSTADPSWVSAPDRLDAGSAIERGVGEHGYPSLDANNDTVPRPVNNDTGWRLGIYVLQFPSSSSQKYPMDVTAYAVCI